MSAALETHGLPDPDLLVRTAGERRLSNFLLWQVSYAEIFVTDVLWPEFKVPELQTALADFAARRRTYGGLDGAREAAAT
jgi:undecaprenyl diphosphate synthase